MGKLDRLTRVVVVLGGADLGRQLRERRAERNLTVLILDVELERVQALVRQAHILIELAVEICERHRHVHASNLARQRPQRLLLGLRSRRRSTRVGGRVCRSRGIGGEETGAQSDDRSSDRYDRKGCHAAATLAPSSVFAPQPEPLAGVDRLPHGSCRLRPHADSVHRGMCKTIPAPAGWKGVALELYFNLT